MKLTPAQQSRLLAAHTLGEWDGPFSTMKKLLDLGLGLVAEVNKNLVVTPAGQAYCDENHMNIQLKRSAGNRRASVRREKFSKAWE